MTNLHDWLCIQDEAEAHDEVSSKIQLLVMRSRCVCKVQYDKVPHA